VGRTLPSQKLKAAMQRSGMDMPALSQKTGLALWTLERIAAGGRQLAASTRKIEFALGEAVWVTPKEFEFRLRVSEWFGVNIYTTPLHQLRAAVRKSHGIIIRTANLMRRPTEARLEAIFYEANPTIRRQ